MPWGKMKVRVPDDLCLVCFRINDIILNRVEFSVRIQHDHYRDKKFPREPRKPHSFWIRYSKNVLAGNYYCGRPSMVYGDYTCLVGKQPLLYR